MAGGVAAVGGGVVEPVVGGCECPVGGGVDGCGAAAAGAAGAGTALSIAAAKPFSARARRRGGLDGGCGLVFGRVGHGPVSVIGDVGVAVQRVESEVFAGVFEVVLLPPPG